MTEAYRIVYWEDAGDENRGMLRRGRGRRVAQYRATIRDRFYVRANYAIGGDGTMDTRYVGTALPERSGAVRWLAIGVEVRRSITGT